MSEDTEIQRYLGRCRCCLKYGCLKYMWSEHLYEGEAEIYGQMLVECFALCFEQSENSTEDDQICETCIIKLRDANNFKKSLLQAQEAMIQLIEKDEEPVVKVERDIENSESDSIVVICKEIDDEQVPSGDQSDDGQAQDAIEKMEYEEVEFLEEHEPTVVEKCDLEELVVSDDAEASASQSNTDKKVPEKKCKWPKKLPKNERYKTYKQYTTEDLKNCLEAVSNEEMTPLEASEVFNIPKKTIVTKVREYKKTDQEQDPKEKTYNFIQEVKMILTYTNVTPFKSKANRYYCAYCASEGPMFDDPNDLRTHTRTVHINDRTSRIEFAMRPHWLNEILKIDIDNLLCNVCCVSITSWNDMFRHLRDKHNVVLDQTYTRLVPYALTDHLKCALCKYPFTNYMHLDSHMNAHYENYICDDCGDTFMSSYRLKQHTKIHSVGKFPCRHCSKVFALEKYRKKHEEMIHELLPKFKCLYCPDKFLNEYFRHLHVVDKHNEKVNIITCELCGLTFTWPAYYHCHMRKKHKKLERLPKFECEFCGNCFYNKELLEEHLETHAGESSYMCGVCSKTFPTMIKMNAHIKNHDKKKKTEDGTTNDDDEDK